MPKILGSSLAEHRERTRTALFGALSELMSQRSFDKITLSDVANHAGVGRTAVYNHFADKEDLLLAFMEHEAGRYAEELSRALGGQLGPEGTDGDGVVVITMSSHLSSTYSTSVAQAGLMDAGITVIDSRSIDMAMGFGVLEAARLARAGASADEVATASLLMPTATSPEMPRPMIMLL